MLGLSHVASTIASPAIQGFRVHYDCRSDRNFISSVSADRSCLDQAGGNKYAGVDPYEGMFWLIGRSCVQSTDMGRWLKLARMNTRML